MQKIIVFLLCMMFAGSMWAQSQLVGQVTDESGTPVPGTTVSVKGTTQGTVSDVDGNYVLNSKSKSGTLVFSFVGLQTLELPFTGNATMNVVLRKSAIDLNEVVAIGYGNVKKRDLTGAISSVKGKDVILTPTNNAMEALQGKVAGMDILLTSGEVGATPEITLRGVRSLYGGNDPLYIVDGLPASFEQINTYDIESIEILKDASSTAIYGSAGANGVVLISTKRGKEGKTQVSIDARYGFSGQAYFKHGMIGDEYIAYKTEAYRTNHQNDYPEDLSQLFNEEDLAAINEGKWIDWVDLCIGGHQQQQKYNISITSGTQKTRIFTSFNVEKEKGLLSNENKDRYGVRLNIDQELASWAHLGTNLNVSYTNMNARSSKIFTLALSSYPLGEPYDENGNINAKYIRESISPLGDEIEGQYVDNRKTIYANGSTYLELTPVKGLLVKSILGATLKAFRKGVYYGPECISNPITGQAPPTAGIYNEYGYGYNWDNIISYNFDLAGAHHFTVTGISSWAFDTYEKNEMTNYGQELDSYSFYNMGAGLPAYNKLKSEYAQKQALSFAGRFLYNYQGKYYVTLTNRWDGVSRLAAGHQWDNFPSTAIAWRVSDENFMEGTKSWLSNLKVRYGWGISGNAGPLSEYDSKTGVATLQKLTINGVAVNHTLYSGTYANPSVGWEKSYNNNIGIDLGLLDNRIDLTIEAYNTDTKDLLCKVKLPVTSGATGGGDSGGLDTWQNIGETNNKGFEITLNTRNIEKRDFKWNSNLTFTRNKQVVVSLPGGDKQIENLFVGYPQGTFYDYKYMGIWGTAEDSLATVYGAQPGYIKLATNPVYSADSTTNDGGVHKYQASDMMKLGNPNPEWIFGFTNTFFYKAFDLTIFTMARWGQMIESDLLSWYDLKSGGVPTGSDYWTPEHQDAYYPRPGLDPKSMIGMESLKYIDGSYFKVKNITLGYTVPANMLKRLKLGNMRLYCTAYNPLIITKEKALKGTDPENKGSDTFPLYRTYVCGLNITF